MEIDKSDLIISLAGRDKGQIFFVTDTQEDYVLIADGKGRKLEQPKRKKRNKFVSSNLLTFINCGKMDFYRS